MEKQEFIDILKLTNAITITNMELFIEHIKNEDYYKDITCIGVIS